MPKLGTKHFKYTKKGWAEYKKAKAKKKKRKSIGDVYTKIDKQLLESFLQSYELGSLLDFEGIIRQGNVVSGAETEISDIQWISN